MAVIPPPSYPNGTAGDDLIVIPRRAFMRMEIKQDGFSTFSVASDITYTLDIRDYQNDQDLARQLKGLASVYSTKVEPKDPDEAINEANKQLREARKRIRELELENKARKEEVEDYEGEIEVLRQEISTSKPSDNIPTLPPGRYTVTTPTPTGNDLASDKMVMDNLIAGKVSLKNLQFDLGALNKDWLA